MIGGQAGSYLVAIGYMIRESRASENHAGIGQVRHNEFFFKAPKYSFLSEATNGAEGGVHHGCPHPVSVDTLPHPILASNSRRSRYLTAVVYYTSLHFPTTMPDYATPKPLIPPITCGDYAYSPTTGFTIKGYTREESSHLYGLLFPHGNAIQRAKLSLDAKKVCSHRWAVSQLLHYGIPLTEGDELSALREAVESGLVSRHVWVMMKYILTKEGGVWRSS
ncbi:hypothetical protein BDD12DRAFT_855526 [Trichophaea hybrida]|nr:hypothetical protein BDD12DRAFT_855526 [Trichophaea hybrida]